METFALVLGEMTVDDNCVVPKQASVMTLESTDIWHRQMGHLHSVAIKIQRESPGNSLDYTGIYSNCDVCASSKSRQ